MSKPQTGTRGQPSRAGCILSRAKMSLQSGRALRPVRAGADAVLGAAHSRVSEAERENVGTQAAHQTERLAEKGLRGTRRLLRDRPKLKTSSLAELLYTELETDLLLQIADTETDYPGFDEYIVVPHEKRLGVYEDVFRPARRTTTGAGARLGGQRGGREYRP